jgi:hypothetical protein
MYLLSAQTDPVAVAAATAPVAPAGPPLPPLKALALHWQEYAMEAAGLGFCMISACLCGALYENLASPVRQALAWPLFPPNPGPANHIAAPR